VSFLYFAYGSNMLPARLAARCPSARVMGVATASGRRLEFSKPGKDGSGKATLKETSDGAQKTPGIVFEIARRDLASLDRAEGAGFGYDRLDDFKVQARAPHASCTVTTYLARRTDIRLRPFDWYLALVLAGARCHGLGASYERQLRQGGYEVDTDLAREGRVEALVALDAHGHADYAPLLAQAGG